MYPSSLRSISRCFVRKCIDRQMDKQRARRTNKWTDMPIPIVPTTLLRGTNMANLRDLITATGLVILLKFDPNHRFFSPCDFEIWWMTSNKANLRDLIAATGLVILLKLDLNHRFFSPCDLEIWWMTQKNNRAPLLCYFKLFASFRSHWWMQTGVTVRKRLIWVKIDAFLSRVTLKLTDDLQKQ